MTDPKNAINISAQTEKSYLLSKQQIKACYHPAGRMIFWSAAVFCMSLLIAIGLILSTELGWHRQLARELVAAHIDDLRHQDSEFSLNPDSHEPPTSSHYGVWRFDSSSPWGVLRYDDKGISLEELKFGEIHLHHKYKAGYLLIERVVNKGDGPVVEMTAASLSFQGDKLFFYWNDEELVAFRDFDASEEILFNDLFNGYLPIYDDLKNGVSLADMALVVFGLLAFIALLKLSLYSSTQVNGIKLTPSQFPKAYVLYERMSRRMGFQRTPEIYLTNGNGVYNAFAACVSGYRKYTCINAEVFQAYENGGDEKVFLMIVGHELGHLRLGHTGLFKNLLGYILSLIPYIGSWITSAYGRAFEYEADRMSLHFVKGPEAAKSYLMLHSNNVLYSKVNLESYRKESASYLKLGMILRNMGASHPIAPWRVDSLCHCRIGGLFLHDIRPEGEAAAADVRDLFQSYRQ